MRDMRTFLDSAQAFLITSIIKVLALRCMYLYQSNKACENLLLYIFQA